MSVSSRDRRLVDHRTGHWLLVSRHDRVYGNLHLDRMIDRPITGTAVRPRVAPRHPSSSRPRYFWREQIGAVIDSRIGLMAFSSGMSDVGIAIADELAMDRGIIIDRPLWRSAVYPRPVNPRNTRLCQQQPSVNGSNCCFSNQFLDRDRTLNDRDPAQFVVIATFTIVELRWPAPKTRLHNWNSAGVESVPPGTTGTRLEKS